jgi:hypothetical protein
MSWLVEWPWSVCPACQSTPECPVWFGVTARVGYPVRSCEFYPCICQPKYSKCRWRGCGCWGRQPDDRLPDLCCAFAPNNPALVPDGTVPEALRASGGYPDSPEPPTTSRRGSEISSRGISATRDPLLEHVWRRVWSPDELSCTCSTPWDGRAVGSGVHCVDCHYNFKSQLVYTMHRRGLGPCRDPREVADVDTGVPLLVCNQAGVWSVTTLPTWRRPVDRPR